MWFKLAKADFSGNNLGTMESISKSYKVTYSLGEGLTGSPTSVSYSGKNKGDEVAHDVTLGVRAGFVLKKDSIVYVDGTQATIVDKDYEAGSSFVFNYKFTKNVEISASAEPAVVEPTSATVTFVTTPATGVTIKVNGSIISGKTYTGTIGSTITWEVSAENHEPKSDSVTISAGGNTVNVTLDASSGGSGGTNTPVNPPSKPEVTTGTLPLVQHALSVVSGENFYHVGTANKARMSTSSVTEETGIWVDAGATITLTGTSGLRFDYVYATKPGPNSNDKTVNTIGGVGTASNFNATNFFPLNADGSSNTISITNDKGTGYYYFFAIAAPNKSNQILVANYQGKITYTVTPANDTPSGDIISSGPLFLQNGALSVVKGENFFVSLNSDTSKTKRMNSSSLTEATGILVPNGKTITLTGTSGLRFDYVYATKAGPNSSTDKSSNVIGGVGTASNFVTSNYFPLNANGSSNTISVTNNYGQDYYYHFAIAGPRKNEVLNPSDYNITYVVS